VLPASVDHTKTWPSPACTSIGLSTDAVSKQAGDLRAQLPGDPGDGDQAGLAWPDSICVSSRRLTCDRSASCWTVSDRSERSVRMFAVVHRGHVRISSRAISALIQTVKSCVRSWKALNSSALPEGSRRNIVHCSPGWPSNRT